MVSHKYRFSDAQNDNDRSGYSRSFCSVTRSSWGEVKWIHCFIQCGETHHQKETYERLFLRVSWLPFHQWTMSDNHFCTRGQQLATTCTWQSKYNVASMTEFHSKRTSTGNVRWCAQFLKAFILQCVCVVYQWNEKTQVIRTAWSGPSRVRVTGVISSTMVPFSHSMVADIILYQNISPIT